MSVCLISSVFCKSCKPKCESEIVLKELEQKITQKSTWIKQFYVCILVRNSYKTRKLLCIGNSEENIDMSQIYLPVMHANWFFQRKDGYEKIFVHVITPFHFSLEKIAPHCVCERETCSTSCSWEMLIKIGILSLWSSAPVCSVCRGFISLLAADF